jgi:hypothetical protein
MCDAVRDQVRDQQRGCAKIRKKITKSTHYAQARRRIKNLNQRLQPRIAGVDKQHREIASTTTTPTPAAEEQKHQ